MGPRDLITRSPRSRLLNPGLSWDKGSQGVAAFLFCLMGNLGAKRDLRRNGGGAAKPQEPHGAPRAGYGRAYLPHTPSKSGWGFPHALGPRAPAPSPGPGSQCCRQESGTKGQPFARLCTQGLCSLVQTPWALNGPLGWSVSIAAAWPRCSPISPVQGLQVPRAREGLRRSLSRGPRGTSGAWARVPLPGCTQSDGASRFSQGPQRGRGGPRHAHCRPQVRSGGAGAAGGESAVSWV
ncbi:bcl-2-binding component 3, isoforms 3/4-like [Bos taurus]|uniref:bcl-2-binding component 3, isoforms 3/4-like n=1 Tax=Bos taurus TaxID=9913 RepID=UPI0028CB5102|nr:bcl-2-binding component 3, isoforms 3/4-like [Bos taurus]